MRDKISSEKGSFMPKNIHGIEVLYRFRGHLQNIKTVGKMGTKQPKKGTLLYSCVLSCLTFE